MTSPIAGASSHRPSTSPDSAESGTDPNPSGYTLFAILRRDHNRPPQLDSAGVTELDEAITSLGAEDIIVRGIYDVSGMRADADVMLWLHGDDAEGLQRAFRGLMRTTLLRDLLPTWNAMGMHRDAEFNRQHVPGFLRGVEPKAWLCVYPFVRSYEWYLLDPADRGRMLADHGRKGAAFGGVTANTVASFALGDYEWLLPMESDDLGELVDLMRDLRATEARRHVREEVPFFTGRRIGAADLLEVLQR